MINDIEKEHSRRMIKLFELNECPIKGKSLKRLDHEERDFILKFISNNRDLSDKSFKGKANHLFIDGERPKNYICIVEVLMSISGS